MVLNLQYQLNEGEQTKLWLKNHEWPDHLTCSKFLKQYGDCRLQTPRSVVYSDLGRPIGLTWDVNAPEGVTANAYFAEVPHCLDYSKGDKTRIHVSDIIQGERTRLRLICAYNYILEHAEPMSTEEKKFGHSHDWTRIETFGPVTGPWRQSLGECRLVIIDDHICSKRVSANLLCRYYLTLCRITDWDSFNPIEELDDDEEYEMYDDYYFEEHGNKGDLPSKIYVDVGNMGKFRLSDLLRVK